MKLFRPSKQADSSEKNPTFRPKMNRLTEKLILIAACLLSLASQSHAQVYERLFDFAEALSEDIERSPLRGRHSTAALVQGVDGNFYGTTTWGGANDHGSIFRMTPSGVVKTLVDLAGDGSSNKGVFPYSRLLLASDGNFYGTTRNTYRFGDANNCGTVFRMTPQGTMTTLVEFSRNGSTNKGCAPYSCVIQDADGSFYGTTSRGGSSDLGTVFRMTGTGVLTTLVEFSGNGPSNKGAEPFAELVKGSDGYFYGTTTRGGSSDLGTIFRMSPSGELVTLVEFTGDGPLNKGADPHSELVESIDGRFYGTTRLGGTDNLGTIFEVTKEGELTTLVSFTGIGSINRGSNPRAALVFGGNGHLYGTTETGGEDGWGTIFSVSPEGTLTTLAELTEAESHNSGRLPYAPLLLASDGNFYGTTEGGSWPNFGTVFRITPSGTFTTMAAFSGQKTFNSGKNPTAGLALGSDGALYGTTLQGGANNFGTLFRMPLTGRVATVFEFPGGLVGREPWGELMMGSDGAFYGTALAGGTTFDGTVYRMTANGEVSGLINFTGNGGANKGSRPYAKLIEGSDGNFYGTTREGGENGHGTVFRLTPEGEFTTLVEFSCNGPDNKGRYPVTALLEGSDGYFYGTTKEGGALNYGTVFRMSGDGELTTLVEFTWKGAIKGSSPRAELIESSDGSFYGTTSSGGENNNGTVFRITPNGELETLVEFDYNGPINKGWSPGSLTFGGDGNLYGATSNGGSYERGTVFRITPSGEFTTVHEFSSVNNGHPYGKLLLAPDGNLYGTTDGSFFSSTAKGTVYRILFPGAPLLEVTRIDVGNDTAQLEAMVNARGGATTVYLDYGIDDTNFSTIPVRLNLTGYQSALVGTTLSGLTEGTTYYYRFRAINISGTSTGPTKMFTTSLFSLPVASASTASEITSNSARFNGIVNARYDDAAVRFEWGTDGNNFPNSAPASPGSVSGNLASEVSFSPVLFKDTTYHYRIVATNILGTSVSGTQSFRTLTEPVATIGGYLALTSSRVRVEGIVDPKGSTTSVAFDYWPTDEEETPRSVTASPITVSGQGGTPVSAVLPDLRQGVTYHYQIRATSNGNLIGKSAPAWFLTDPVFDLNRESPATLQSGHSLTVNLFPAVGVLHGWRFAGEREWRSSGEEVRGLSGGDRVIEFRPFPGYLHPPSEIVDFSGGASSSILDRQYFETDGLGIGEITVKLKPESIAGPGHAQWRLLGEGPEDWRDSGVTLSDLIPGVYLIEFKPVAGRETPPNSSVVVGNASVSLTVIYAQAIELQANPPSVLDFETVEGDPGELNPFAYSFVGQIRSTVGTGTGFAVKQRVVATAAHVVWDDVTLSAAQGLEWLHQRHRGDYEPEPLAPRGFYLLDGYAAKRLEENSPGSFLPESRNLDVAAMYFTGPDAHRLGYAALGGYGGYLGSDLDDNEFLLSNANKMLLGYPIDGIAPENRSRMHASTPVNVAFTKVPEANRTFRTADIRSSGGASGGPLCVEESGIYYPAAIYLGGNDQTIVRAIDSDVVRLFNLAEAHSLDPNGNVGGGISLTGSNLTDSSTSWGGLRVNLSPPAVANAGAGWRLRPEKAYRASGARRDGLNPGLYRLEFSDVSGYQTPPMQVVGVVGGQTTTLTFTYAPAAPSAAKVAVRGKGRNIANGDISPSALDGSDFGLVAIDGGTATRTFTVSNPGTAALSLGSVVVGGSHPDDFSASIPPGANVPPGGSTTFTVLFDPSAAGTRSATVSFATNVAGSNPFSFAIQGNNTTDSDSDGFSDVEEAALTELLAQFAVGQSVNLDLSFLRLGDGQILALLNLPPGLSFDPATQRITGTIAAKGATPQIEVRKLDGAVVVSTVSLSMPVSFPGRVALARVRPFPATKIGRRSRPQTLRIENAGEMTLARLSARISGKAARDFLLTRPAASLAPGGSTSVKVVFRPRGKGMRRAGVTIFSNTAPRSVPVSGKGR